MWIKIGEVLFNLNHVKQIMFGITMVCIDDNEMLLTESEVKEVKEKLEVLLLNQ